MKDFIAHIYEKDGKIRYQTVKEHCENVAELSGTYAKKINACNMGYLQGIFHDAGKLCECFDDYINGRNGMARGSIDHCYAGARYLTEYANATKNIKYIEMIELLSRCIMSHHSVHDWIDSDGEDYFSGRIYSEKNSKGFKEIEKNIQSIISDPEVLGLFEKAITEYGVFRKKILSLSEKNSRKTAFYFGMLERLLESILVDADRTDTANFQYNTNVEKVSDDNIWDLFCGKIEETSREFEKKENAISKLRCDISRRCKEFASEKREICQMIVPTGGGKTISSLRFAINYCKNHGKERIFYIAPYCSILEQNSGVLNDILGEENVLEHHSNLIAELDNDEDLKEYELRTEKWDCPVIATTFVQFLNTFFSNKMSSVRRMHRLCNSVIIIDEVQSVPVKCVNLFNMAMNFISKIGNSCVVLCSATQPRFEKTDYKLLLDTNPSMTGNYEMDFKKLKRNQLVPVDDLKGFTYKEAADFCMNRAEDGSVLFVVNTKKAAISIYDLLKERINENTKIIHLSTNMCPERRKNIINKMKQELKNTNGRKIICITTQLIEAGVDLSFPCVIRSLAGLDNAAQAAGRCNRNGEFSENSKVYIIYLKEECLNTLVDIKEGQKITGQIIRNTNTEDLLNVEKMSMYFEKYYMERKEELSYNVKDESVDTDLINLLSTNKERWNLKHEKISVHAQAFDTAGRYFEVIDSNTVSVIVPDNEEAKEIISRLFSDDITENSFKKILRKAQKYTVEIYDNMKKILEQKSAIQLLPCGVHILKEEYYNQEIGVVLEGKSMDLLMF